MEGGSEAGVAGAAGGEDGSATSEGGTGSGVDPTRQNKKPPPAKSSPAPKTAIGQRRGWLEKTGASRSVAANTAGIVSGTVRVDGFAGAVESSSGAAMSPWEGTGPECRSLRVPGPVATLLGAGVWTGVVEGLGPLPLRGVPD